MNYVIIGNSAAAVGAIESIRKSDQEGSITVIADEDRHVYSRPLIAHMLAGEITENALNYRPETFYSDFKVNVILGQKANHIDPHAQKITLDSGKKIAYDQLLISTGSKAAIPPIPGKELAGVSTFQNYEQAREIMHQLSSGRKKAVVIGAGLIGMRAAYGLKEAGAEVNIIEFLPRVLSRVLDAEGSTIVEKILRRKGFHIYTGRAVQEIKGSSKVESVALDDGTQLACDIVVLATGVAPNVDIVSDTPVKINNGILVNKYFQATFTNIYAAGDVAETHDIPRDNFWVNANWPNAHEQGRIAGINMSGGRQAYQGSLGMNVVSFGNIPVISLGIFDPETEGFSNCDIKMRKNENEFIYQKLVFKNNRLKGAIFIGDIGYCGAVKELIKDQSLVGIIKDSILEEKYQLYNFLRKKRQSKLEGEYIQWPETYSYQTPYVKSFDEASWTRRERNERSW